MTYIGVRTARGCLVRIHDDNRDADMGPLPPRDDLKDFGVDEYAWGRPEGGGPARLALAILANHLASDLDALALYPAFRSAVVANLRGDQWFLTGEAIDRELEAIRAARAERF